jgi:membrane fusion protein (multidrug efflux system)
MSMTKRMLIMLVSVALLFGLVFGFEAFRNAFIAKMMSSLGAPIQVVATAKAVRTAWQPRLSAVGSLRAVNGADLAFEVAGIVSAIAFRPGEDVAQGALLFTLASADDLAKLHALQASADLARITLARDQAQIRVQAISQATVDADGANLKNLLAQVEEQQAILDKKSLHAPFAGRIGLRVVDLGQYLAAGTQVATLQALDPMYVDFTLPQQEAGEIAIGRPITATINGGALAGTINAIDPKVDAQTRNLTIRATVANPQKTLLPGMFATISIDVGEPQQRITLPQTAIVYNTYGDSVYLVEDKGADAAGKPKLIVHQSIITAGATRGDQVAILSGVKEGDTVVVSGQVKLHNLSPISVNNQVLPTDDPNPKPIDQ